MWIEIEPGKYAKSLGGGWEVQVMIPAPGVVVVGLFQDGELVVVVDDAEGEGSGGVPPCKL